MPSPLADQIGTRDGPTLEIMIHGNPTSPGSPAARVAAIGLRTNPTMNAQESRAAPAGIGAREPTRRLLGRIASLVVLLTILGLVVALVVAWGSTREDPQVLWNGAQKDLQSGDL